MQAMKRSYQYLKGQYINWWASYPPVKRKGGFTVYRADSRPYDVVKKAGGFNPKEGVELKDNINAWDIKIYQKDNSQNPGLISTSEMRDSAENFGYRAVKKNSAGNYFLYEIAIPEDFEDAIDVQKTTWSILYAEQQEIAVPRQIPIEWVKSCVETNADGELPGAEK